MLKIPSIFKNKELTKHPWQWPSCKNPKTLSFRVSDDDNLFKTVNSIFLDPIEGLETLESSFANSNAECVSDLSTNDQSEPDNNFTEDSSESFDVIIRRVRSSERLFFELGDTSSMLKEPKTNDGCDQAMLPFKESVALALESNDPYMDFKRSMQEMIETHRLNKDWDCLEEMLGWYLKMNGKTNHAVIVGAFVDVLIELASSSYNNNNNNSNTTTTTITCCSDSSSSSLGDSCFSSPSSPLSSTTKIDNHGTEIM